MAKTPACPMPPPSAAMADPKLAVAQINSVILYDATSGMIAGGLQSTTLVGAMVPTLDTLENTARANLAISKPGVSSNLAALHLEGSLAQHLCPGKTYKVMDCAIVEG